MGMISPEILQQLYGKWQDRLNQDDGELLKKIICIDGKTMRSNKRGAGKAAHIVSAWSKEDGFCLGQKAVEEKSNEIVVIPELLDKIQIKGQTVTIDAMGTQTAIAEKIKKKRFGIPNRFYFRQAFITDSISSLLLSILFAVLISSRHLDSFCTCLLYTSDAADE